MHFTVRTPQSTLSTLYTPLPTSHPALCTRQFTLRDGDVGDDDDDDDDDDGDDDGGEDHDGSEEEDDEVENKTDEDDEDKDEEEDAENAYMGSFSSEGPLSGVLLGTTPFVCRCAKTAHI